MTRLWRVCRVGQNCIYTPYMTVYLVIFLPKIPYTHRIYMALANPTCVMQQFVAPQKRAPATTVLCNVVM
jgi:hypothetical protein